MACLLARSGKANVGFWCRQFPENEARCRYNVGHAGHIRETSPLFCDESIAPKSADALQFDVIDTWGDGVSEARALSATTDPGSSLATATDAFESILAKIVRTTRGKPN